MWTLFLTEMVLFGAEISERKLETSEKAPSVPTPLITVETNKVNESLPLPQIAPLVTEKEKNELNTVFSRGRELFDKEDWIEARNLFEKAVRQFPQNSDIQKCYVRARCYLEVANRYKDPTFINVLENNSLDEIQFLYNEVFANIQTWHVDTPEWKTLLEHGIDGLEAAFTESGFMKRYNINKEQSKVLCDYCNELMKIVKENDIRSCDDLRNWIFTIAERLSEKTYLTQNAVILEFVCSITCSLDPWSSFLTPGQIKDVYSMIDGHFVGLGVELKMERDALRILRVIPHSPAENAGLHKGERILSINGVRTDSSSNAEQTGMLLQGKEGTFVLLKISGSDQQVREINVERRRVDVPSVENVQILSFDQQRNKVGYLKISCFQKTTATELKTALEYLSQQGMQCLIIDLRQNPGGLLQEAIEVCDLFLDKGTIVRTRGRFTDRPYFAQTTQTWKTPLLVLIDGNSASASEIFAGAIRENARGRIIGTRSYGKGTVQALIRLRGTNQNQQEAGLRLTTEKFYSPKGNPYSGIGVEPDIFVSDPVDSNQNVFQNVSDSNSINTFTKMTGQSSDPCIARAWTEAQLLLDNHTKISNHYTDIK